MKGFFVVVVMVWAVIAATKQHVHKDNAQGARINKMAAGLAPVMAYLPADASFSFKMPEGAPGDAYMIWRYLMAPRYASIDAAEQFDTTLSILNMNASDSLVHAIETNTRVIASGNDGQYKYYLTSNKR